MTDFQNSVDGTFAGHSVSSNWTYQDVYKNELSKKFIELINM